MIFDYATLKLIWWGFISLLFILFFVLGGRDFGVCMLLPFLSRKDEERRLVINSISATWEGNQVWFITAGGATFAAWPIVYATAFSGLYFALLVVLISLILRPPGFDFRSKMKHPAWRSLWDWCLFLSGFVPALVFGVGLGNLFLGLPFYFDNDLRSFYEGNFFQLLNPFSVLMGLASVMLLSMHGAAFLKRKVQLENPLRLQGILKLNMLSFIVLFVLLGIWMLRLKGYEITSALAINENIIPINKTVGHASSWLANYNHYPWLWALPVLTVLCVFLTKPFGMFMSSLAIVFALLTANATLFPFILPSSVNPNHSITLWDAVSTHRTLQYMFWVTVLFMPIVLGYTFWVFRVIKGQLRKEEVLGKVESY